MGWKSIRRVLAALFVTLTFVSVSASAQTASVDWSTLGVGSLQGVSSGSSTTATDGTTATVTHSSVTNGGTFVPTYGGSFISYFSGTIGGASQVLLANFDNNAYDPADKVTAEITLGRTVTGLSFRLTDVDTGGFRDAVSVFYDTGSGTFQNAAANTAFWTANSGVGRTNDAVLNGWTGTANSDQTATTGDLIFNFGTTAVRRIRIVYHSYTGTGDPGAQYMGVSGLTFNAIGADLSLTKTIRSSNPATAGSTSVFRLTVTSSASSTVTATGVQVRDILPNGLTFVSASGTGSYNAGTGIWSVGSVAPGSSVFVDISATINATSGASIRNIAEIFASSAPDWDSTPANGVTSEDDYATATLTVGGTRTAGMPPALTCPAGYYLFDWDSRTYTAGSTNASYPLDAMGSMTIAITNPGTFLNNATLGGQSPNRQTAMNGGTGQNSLIQLVDLPARSDVVTTTFVFPTIMRGAQFTVFDVDSNPGQFADRVEVVGQYQGANIFPMLTNGLSNYVIGNQAFGDGASDTPDADGNVTVTFTQPIDRIIIRYGNHDAAPANPGQQAIAIHDLNVCRPTTSIQAAKSSTVVSDPISGTTNPKAIPGARVRYCVTLTNGGDTAAVNVSASDVIQSDAAFVAGSMRSGSVCGDAAQVEDDDATGVDETDPYGASISGDTLSLRAANLPAGSSFAVTFDVEIR